MGEDTSALPGTACVLANKIDLLDKNDRVVSEKEGKQLAEEHGFPYFETSAKTGFNVEQSFEKLASNLVDLKIQRKMSTDSNCSRSSRSSGSAVSSNHSHAGRITVDKPLKSKKFKCC